MDPDFSSFDRTFQMMQGLIVVVFVVVIAVFIFALVKRAGQYSRNQAAPEVSAVAAIVDKRIETSGGGDTMVRQTHFISFQQPSGERFELEVPASEYGLLVVGDQGTVSMKGTRYLGFAREVMR
jgi:hypothetical protein